MRLDEWQKFIESQFLEDTVPTESEPAPAESKKTPVEPAAEPSLSLDFTELPTVPSPNEPPSFVVVSRPARSESSEKQKTASAPGSAPKEPTPVFGGVPELDVEVPAFANYLTARRNITPELKPPATTEENATLPSVSSGEAASFPTLTEEERETRNEEFIAPANAVRPRVPRSRARHARNVRPENLTAGLVSTELWAKVPKHVETLLALERMEEQEVAQSSYKRPFAEKRRELIERLLDPILSLEETARLLNVCPTTVRRYTNKGILTHYRKEPERSTKTEAASDKETRQRRFRLSDILLFLETQQGAIEADRKADERHLIAQEEAEWQTTPYGTPPPSTTEGTH